MSKKSFKSHFSVRNFMLDENFKDEDSRTTSMSLSADPQEATHFGVIERKSPEGLENLGSMYLIPLFFWYAIPSSDAKYTLIGNSR